MLEEPIVTGRDLERSATASGLPALRTAVEPLRGARLERMLDVGCGYGGLAGFLGTELGITDLHGVDIDDSVLPEARSKGVQVKRVDVESEALPYEDESFDLVVSLGMLDYLPTFDRVVREIHRVLRPEGHALVSIPNLASWHNRLALLLGYQPRDVEISDRFLPGTMRYYRKDPPAGHIHTATARGLRELMEFHGFQTAAVTGGCWTTRPTPTALALVDRVLSRRPSLARRIFYRGTKGEPQGAPGASSGWWRGRTVVREGSSSD